MAIAGTLAVNVVANTAPFARGMQMARGQLAGFRAGLRSTGLGSMIPQLAAATAGVALLTSALSKLRGEFRKIDEITKTARSLDITTESLVGLQHAVNLTSTASDETLTKSLRRMTKTVADANSGLSTAQRAFDNLGISAKELSDLSADEQFLRIADAMRGLEGSAKQQTFQDIFGRGAGDLINTLDQGSAGIREMQKEAKFLGITFSGEGGEAVEAMNDEITKLMNEFGGMFRQVAIAVAPFIQEWIRGVRTIFAIIRMVFEQVQKIVASIPGLRVVGEIAGTILNPGQAATRLIGAAWGDAVLGASDAAFAANKNLKDYSLGLDEAAEASESLAEATSAAADSFEQMKAAGEAIRRSVRTPTEELNEEMLHLRELFTSGAISTETFQRAARRAMEDASDALGAAKKLSEIKTDPIAATTRNSVAGFSQVQAARRAASDAKKTADETKKRDTMRNKLLEDIKKAVTGGKEFKITTGRITS